MRILAIRGADLASLAGTFAVELDRPPLDRAGLFAIAGPTGSGKSTLLDALCLALYDRVPRLEGFKGPAVGRADENEDARLRAHDVRGVLRRGAGSAFAEVDFAGRDGRRWRARWEVRRARGRADGRFQDQQMSLVDAETDEPVGRTKIEVLDAIAERVGLSYDQFRRSVLLAQGEFAAFLRASAADRAALLERLTGTELYGRISVAAHERARLEAAELSALEIRLADTAPLPDEQRTALESRRKAASAALADARKAETAARAAVEWHRNRVRLAAAVAQAETEAAAARTAWDGAADRRAELEATRVAEALRSPVETAEHTEREAQELGERAAAAAATSERAVAVLAAADTELAAAAEAEGSANGALEAARPELDRAAQLDTVIASAARELAASQREAEVARERREGTEGRRSSAAADAEAAEGRRETDAAWLAKHAAFEPLAREWPRWREALGRLTRARRDTAEVRPALDLASAELEAVRADAAATLRADLVPGRPCPVCGATEHPRADHDGRSGRGGDWRTLEARRAELEARLAAAADVERDTLTTLGPIATVAPGGQAALDDDLDTTRERWNAAAAEWHARSESVRRAEADLAGARSKLAAAEAEAAHETRSVETAEKTVAQRQKAVRAPTAERAALLGGRSTAEVRARLEKAAAATRKAAQAARDRRAEAAAAAERDRAFAESAAEAASAARRRADAAHSLRDRRLAETGLEPDAVRKRLARGEGWITVEAQALETLDRVCERTAAILGERSARLAEHDAADPPSLDAETAESALAHAALELESHQRAWAEAEGGLAADDRRRALTASLAGELALRRERADLWAQLRELVGSHDGSKLRTFAQGLTLDALVAHANHHLADLARRYRLARVPGSDLELQVVDREMADEVRAVQSLSGGESFLVSLALALGLASLASRRVAVESLFVDEGFGSLDPDALDAALAGLDALQALGRQVGVISHVPAMVERIGVQVRLEPRGGGRSAVRVLDAGGMPPTAI